LVIILEESLGAEYVGSLGGLPLTPNLDRLGHEGMLLTNLYSTGTRTVRGIEATVAGFLPTAGSSVVKLGHAQHNFFTVADLLRRHGYATEFVYGGRSNFDNMASFFLGNGFERVIDEASFTNPALRGTWGVSDEDLLQRTNDVFAAHGTKPFFALVLTTSNHPPYEYPPGRIASTEEPSNTSHNAIRYADFALGKFFELAQPRRYFSDTIF
jgi:phosphoglycerol transferase MdoB-like AlkP superfamily enzyme